MSDVMLGELAQVVDCEHKTAPEALPGTAFGFSVGTPALRGSGIDFSQAKPVDEDTYHSWSRRAEPTKGDLILAREAPVGGVGFVDGSHKVCLGQRTVLVRANQELVDPRFLFYLLRSPAPQAWMDMHSEGSTVRHLNVADVRRISLGAVPPFDEQRRIAGVLGALDDLIEVNRGLINDLDATLAASWSMAARASATTKMFGEVADAQKGLSYKGVFLVERGLPMINMGSFGVDGKYRESGLKWYVESEVKPKNRLVKGDLVIVNTDLTQSRDILARPIVVPYAHATSTHHTYQVRVPGGEAQRFWLYCALREESVRQRLISYATGTTVAALPKDALSSQDIPWADDASIASWWLHAEPLYSSQLALHDEIKELTRTRDELLPLLMSGRVRVAEAVAA